MRRALLKPRSPLVMEEVHSDTLFGAICWGYRWLYGEEALEQLLERFKSGEAPFLISSCFPYLEAGRDRVYLYPKPVAFEPGGGEREDAELAKKLKRIKYVSEGLFKKMCASPGVEDAGKHKLHRREVLSFKVGGEWYIADGEVALEREVADRLVDESDEKKEPRRKTLRIMGKYEKPGVQVNRLSVSPEETLHFRSEYTLAPNAGLHFLIYGSQEEVKEVEAALRFLADRGLGGKVSCGRGAFEFNGLEEDVELDKPKQGFVTLSLYLPKKEELSAFGEGNTWYEIAVRKGMVEGSFIKVRNQWKEKLLMFAEGSVFPAAGEEPYGRCEVVKQEPFEVLHYGYAFPVNFRRDGDA